jgi:hypothetical protein
MLSIFINKITSKFNKNNSYETEVTSPFWAFGPGKLDLATAKQCDKIPTQ